MNNTCTLQSCKLQWSTPTWSSENICYHETEILLSFRHCHALCLVWFVAILCHLVMAEIWVQFCWCWTSYHRVRLCCGRQSGPLVVVRRPEFRRGSSSVQVWMCSRQGNGVQVLLHIYGYVRGKVWANSLILFTFLGSNVSEQRSTELKVLAWFMGNLEWGRIGGDRGRTWLLLVLSILLNSIE